MNVWHTCWQCNEDKHESEGEWNQNSYQWICHACALRNYNDPIISVDPEEIDLED